MFGQIRRAGTKNQRTDTLVRRLRLIFTSCAQTLHAHIVAHFHVVFVFTCAKVMLGLRLAKKFINFL